MRASVRKGGEKEMRLLVSPWMESFDSFARSISHGALLVSPFISGEPLQRLASILDKHFAVKIQILTSLNVDSLIQGTTDVGAIASFCRIIHDTTVRHLPRLHAKVYVADDTVAILTSANLTGAGLNQNYEYGIEITDPVLVSKISEDLKAYQNLGAEVSLLDLEQLAEISHELQERQAQVLKSARQTLQREFKRKVEAATEALMYLRAKPGETTNKIFSIF
jgi:phosphatidylserine/phosphatidylglycerophosphate/cardiolipin synthase-like enzyme